MSGPLVTDSARPLSDRHQALIEAYVDAASNGEHLSRGELGRRAGYGTGEVARVQASRALSLPHVQDALSALLQQRMRADAPDVYAGLRYLSRHARSERVRLDALAKHGTAVGMTTEPQGPQGGGVAVNILLGGDAGTLLAQRMGDALQAQPLQRPTVIEHSPMKGAGLDLEPGAPPPPRSLRPRKAPPGAKTGARVSSTGPAHDLPSPKSRGRK